MQVERTKDFDRIFALPRRAISVSQGVAWSEYLTPILSSSPPAKLLPWQALALAEAVACDGAFLGLPVGQGKTLISWLLPRVMQSERALIIVPPSLMQKTHSDFAKLAEDWPRHDGAVRVVSYRQLEVESGEHLLANYRPDLVVADECDKVSKITTACARRLGRYKRANPDARYVAMTGTLARKSLLDYWHWLVWCLGERAPVPMRRSEAFIWGRALDAHKGIRPDFDLLGATLTKARECYRDRLHSTRGVVIVDEDSCTAPLDVRVILAPEDPVLDDAFRTLLIDDDSPGGEPISDPLSRWRITGQLGLGFYTRWNPPPPDEWLASRREAAKFVRDKIEASTRASRPLDTEAQVFRAYPDSLVVKAWRKIKPTFEGVTETIWISRSAIEFCQAWLAQPTPGIVWSGSVDFGERLSAEARCLYFGPKGLDSSGRSLHAAPEGTSFVSSWTANHRGFNLQHWQRHLIVMPPQSAKLLEQIFGRSHRRGQLGGVRVEILATSGATFDLLQTALWEAIKVRDADGMTPKLLRADIEYEHPSKDSNNEFRWATQEEIP